MDDGYNSVCRWAVCMMYITELRIENTAAAAMLVTAMMPRIGKQFAESPRIWLCTCTMDFFCSVSARFLACLEPIQEIGRIQEFIRPSIVRTVLPKCRS